MTDLPSSLGIEAVECVAEGGPSLTVRVIGRWRRRRPEVRGQAVLVVETEAGRQRFQAMPEPPSLTGAAPGTWRMSFSVPAALAPVLPGRTFLQLGGVMVPLPIGEVTIAQGPSPEVLEERRIRGSELAAESARRRAAELAAEVKRLEGELGRATTQSDRLRAEIAERERRLRGAEQNVHAERALRADLEQELAWRTQSAERDMSVLHGRVAELERELSRLRRAVDEAGHLAAAAEARRADAERRLTERPSAPADTSRAADTPPAADAAREALSRLELELDRAARGARPRGTVARPAERSADRVLLGIETGMTRPRGEHVDPRVADLERELVAAHARSARAYEAIALVRAELRELRVGTPPDPPAAQPPAAPAQPLGRPGSVQGSVQPEELTAALARLREQARPEPAPPPAGRSEPARAAKPWLHSAFRRLAADDASAAGRLVLALLPAQRAADPHPVAYDLVLADLLVAHVTSDSLAVHVDHDGTPRPPSEVDFQVVGDLASVARLLRAGRVRRRLRIPPRRIARVRGDRGRLAALDRLIDARLTARELHAAGVTLDPLLTFTLAAQMIEPGWTAGERFTIGHRDPVVTTPGAYLHIRDGRPPLASAEPPHGPVASVLVCPADDLLERLASPDAEVAGEERPVTLLRQWLDRAQCG
ncbi:MAG TPA: hypothetical protein VFH80_16300 [Solirubrobacteraceae bacterium]|nr:hypothetical protein [Solirubrobacteraceae bacterium]